jgi:hypothetical protein
MCHACNRVTEDEGMIQRLTEQLQSSSTSNHSLLSMLMDEQQHSMAHTASFLSATSSSLSSSLSSTPPSPHHQQLFHPNINKHSINGNAI